MVAVGKALEFPMMAGSGLSVTWRMPSVDLPFGAAVEVRFRLNLDAFYTKRDQFHRFKR